tara:strand:- start:1187 stop:1402 length:216 start_codon:yes stop_codon:yes gene_type:complete
MTDQKTAGEIFREKRHALKLTQKNLSDFLEISVRQIERYENNFSEIPGPTKILMDILVTRRWPVWAKQIHK